MSTLLETFLTARSMSNLPEKNRKMQKETKSFRAGNKCTRLRVNSWPRYNRTKAWYKFLVSTGGRENAPYRKFCLQMLPPATRATLFSRQARF